MKNSSIKKLIVYVLSILSIFLLFIITSLIINNELVFPKIGTIFNSLFSLLSKSKTYLIILYTIIRLSFSLIISFLIGFILGIIASKFKNIHLFLKPYFYILRSIPFVAILLIIMMIAGISKTPIIITILVTIPIIYDSVYEGINNIDNSLMKVWSLESKLNFNILKRVVVPLSWSNVKVGILNAISTGIKLIIMAEFICASPNSVGNSLISAANNLDYALVFAWSILIILIVIIFNNLTKLINKNNYIEN